MSLTIEFVAYDADGVVIDHIDPYVSHRPLNDDGTSFSVDNGYGEYTVTVPEGGRYEIRLMQSDL